MRALALKQADEERKAYIERLIADNRRIGELETQLLQFGSGDTRQHLHLPHRSDTHDTRSDASETI